MNLVICAEHETIVSFNAKIRPHDITNSEMKQYCENWGADISSLIVILKLKSYWRRHLTFYFLYSQNDAAEGFVLPKLA